MADWVITATTVYCDAVDDEVTLMVYGDGTSRCTGYDTYAKPEKETARSIKIKSKRTGRQLRCHGPECNIVTQYRDKLLAGEVGAKGSADSE